MSDRPDDGDPFDPFAETPPTSPEANDAPNAAHTVAPDAPADPAPPQEFDPELTARVTPPTPPQPPQGAPPRPYGAPYPDAEPTTTITPTPPLSTPPPAYGAPTPGPYGPPAQTWQQPGAPQYGYALPPVFSAQHAPQQQRPRNRKPMIIAVGAAAAALVVLLVVVIVSAAGRGGGATSAQDAVRGYLDALAQGKAREALAFGASTPGSADLLTDDVLRKQLEHSPITEIKILDNGSPVGDYARIHVSAKFGDTVSDTQLTVRKSGDEWKLPNAAVKLDATTFQNTNKALADLTVFGHTAANPVYVFPGWVDYGSDNPNLDFQATAPLLDQLETPVPLTSVNVDLSEKARNAIDSALKNDLAKCQGSSSLAPPGCPLKASPIGLVDGTAQWGPATIDGQTNEFFSPYQMSVNIIGTASANLTAQSTYAGTTTRRVTGVISGTADVTTDPPTLTYR